MLYFRYICVHIFFNYYFNNIKKNHWKKVPVLGSKNNDLYEYVTFKSIIIYIKAI